MNTETYLRILGAISARDGRLTVAQAKELGISRVSLKRAADEGLIVRHGRNRYLEPGMLPEELHGSRARLGKDAIVALRGAQFLHGLDGIEGFVDEWCVPHGARTPWKLVHQRRHFDSVEVVELNGVYVTSVRQTLADLGCAVDADIVERALESAIRMGLVTDTEMRRFAASLKWTHGGPTLRAVLRRRPVGALPTGSDLETICLQVYRAGGVPTPVRQYIITDRDGLFVARADFGFPPSALVSEVDGMETHGTPEGMQYDYSRQHRIEDLGYRVRRHTTLDVLRRPTYVCRVILRALGDAPLLSTLSSKSRN